MYQIVDLATHNDFALSPTNLFWLFYVTLQLYGHENWLHSGTNSASLEPRTVCLGLRSGLLWQDQLKLDLLIFDLFNRIMIDKM